MKPTFILVMVCTSGLISACGGGSGSDPVANKPTSSVAVSSALLSSSLPQSSLTSSSLSMTSLSASALSTSSLATSSLSQSSQSVSSAANTTTGLSCEEANTPFGFASIDDADKPYSITGGADTGNGNYEVVATTGTQLRNYIYGSAASTYQDKPITIYVEGKITWANSGNSDIRIERSHVSIIGRTAAAEFEGVGIEIRPKANSTVENIVIRNLKMGLVQQDNGAGDAISLNASGSNAKIRNVWIDHNELYNSLVTPSCSNEDCHKDYYDELVSGRGNLSNITISHNLLRDSWKTSLWGSSDSANEDVGRRVTFHHNYWKNVNSRLPLYRYGYLHMLNNVYEDVTGSAINVRMDARALIEGNSFTRVKDPIVSLDSSRLGYWTLGQGDLANSFSALTNVSGNCSSDAPPCRNAHTVSTDAAVYTPAYNYTDIITPIDQVNTFVIDNAGTGIIASCL